MVYEILEPLIVIVVIGAPICLAVPIVRAISERIRRDRNLSTRLDAVEAELEAAREIESGRIREAEHLRAQLAFMQQLLSARTAEEAGGPDGPPVVLSNASSGKPGVR